MPIVTLRPNIIISDANGPGGFNWLGGDVSKVADDIDATYGESNAFSGPASFEVGFQNFTIPAGAVIVSVTPKVRARGSGGGSDGSVVTWGSSGGAIELKDSGSLVTNTFNITLGSIQTHIGTARTTKPSGGAWTQSAIDNMTVRTMLGPWHSTASLRVYDLMLDVLYNEVATVTNVTVPPQIREDAEVTFSFVDPDFNAQAGYQVKVFTSAVVNGGGFNPDSSTNVFDTGNVSGNPAPFNPKTVNLNTNLSPGRYFAYIRVRDDVNGGWSAWAASNEFRVVNSPLMVS